MKSRPADYLSDEQPRAAAPAYMNSAATTGEGSVRPRFLHVWILMAASGCLFFTMLGHLPLIEPDEGRNAEVAREMLAGGDWLVPHYDGFAYLDKPPVLFWLEAASFKFFGVSEFAARIPSALAALATVLLTWLLARRMFGESAGLKAALVFAVAPLTIIFSRFVIFDMPLSSLVTAALVCYWLGEASRERGRPFHVLFFAAMAIATLTKGPVGFLIPLLVIMVYSCLRGRLRDLKKLPWGWGLVVFAGIVLPWFIVVSARHPDFPRYALWQESLERFMTSEAHRSGGVFYYIPVYLAGFLPWSFFLLFAALGWLRRWRELRHESSAPVLFLLTWAGVIFVFFSFSHSKLPGYFLPAVIPLSILMGTVWSRAEPSLNLRIPDWMTAGFAALILLGLLMLIAPEWTHFPSLRTRLARKLPSDVRALINPSLVYSGLILMALGVIGRNLLSRAQRKGAAWLAFALLSLSVPLLFLRCAKPLDLYASENSSRHLARTILASPEKGLPIVGYYYFRTSLPFYLRRPVGLVTSGGSELTSNYVVSGWPGIQSEANRRLFPELTDVAGWPAGEGLLVRESDWLARARPWPTLVMLPDNLVSDLARTGGKMDALWSGWNYSVWEFSARKH